jgi:hypothetical protein
MAGMMKLGALPRAVHPDDPTTVESAAVREKVAANQAVFNTH